jgi:GNAT superfamily N-acetyltransferase
MTILYKQTLPDKEQFFELFESTGWNVRYQLDREGLLEAVRRSWYWVCAYEGDRLVGFGRIICDGVVHALILDLIVLPSHQERGIGGYILNDLVERCRSANIRDVQLFCAKNKAGFYEKRGFMRRPVDAPGMEFKESDV